MSQQSAQGLKESYTPQDQQRFDSMVKVLSNAETRSELDGLVLLYLPDMSYTRPDIAYADAYVAHLKGWKGGPG